MSNKVIFIRGPQGSGKSTLMRKSGLEGHNISKDKIRDIISGDILNPSGYISPSHANEPLVAQLFEESMARRARNGEIVCVDGTMANGSQLYQYWQIFEQAGYSGLVVDFYGFDDRLRAQRNAARPERLYVNENSVDRMKSMASDIPIPDKMKENSKVEFMNVSNDQEFEVAVSRIDSFLKDPRCVRDLSHYDKVVHIGDLQGCFDPIIAEGSPLRGGLDPDTFYVFLGDLFDRGLQNGDVGKWFMREVYGKPNAVLIAGNHEDYVDKQARAARGDIGLPKSEWERFSWPQLKLAGLDHRDCRKISAMSQDYLAYHWRGKDVLCSHSGFPRWPSNLDLVSRRQFRNGCGQYTQDVDASWTASEMGKGRYQVHGHRNSLMLPTIATELSMNLEGQVEFGGHMRFVTLDNDGFTPTDIRSTTFRSMQRDTLCNHAVDRSPSSRHAPLMPWGKDDRPLPKISQALIDRTHNHDMINIKPSESLPGVFSVNFTHKAFKNAAWDDYTTVARGLYIDGETRTIVARSYEKFFNLNERPETREDTIADRLTFPVNAYEKSNGFLCITGYSERHGELVVASKSVTDGAFPTIAEDVLASTLGDGGMERLLRFNRDQQSSLVFEIEDPDRDPHIIKIEKPKVTLLACIRRTETFEQASYEDLKKIGAWLGCDVKRQIARLPNAYALTAFNRRVENDPKWTINGKPVEGCVMEDDNGEFYKLKSHYYRNWKRMRSAVNYMRKCKLKDVEIKFDRYEDVPAKFQEFMQWASTLSAKALELDIISLREAFEGDRAKIEAIKDELPAVSPKEAARIKQFNSVIDNIASNENISDDSLQRFVENSLGDPVKSKILLDHPKGQDLIDRAACVETAPDSEPGF